MRKLALYLTACFCFILNGIYAQNHIALNEHIVLYYSVVPFETKHHEIELCYFQNQPYYCLIDGKEWFGSDMGTELPKYEIKELYIIQNGIKIDLDYSKMFNPVFDTVINEQHFSLEDLTDGILLKGWFSDGAGTYCVEWEIKNKIALRTLISNSESDCFE